MSFTIEVDTEELSDAFYQVYLEMLRQNTIWGNQRKLPMRPPYITRQFMESVANNRKAVCDKAAEEGQLTWYHIIEEEQAEVFAEDDPERQIEELIQVAAVCLQAILAIRRTNEHY